ncbi:phosphoribosyltransferase domain-containing protein [Arthrobacter sp. NPDC057013]|uniref:phosphoribosyltransferase domain-containing protein n=1 Tax=Arthrobacter sp. NPDC057013 TaxID=3345999 RepID=UPI00362DF3FE
MNVRGTDVFSELGITVTTNPLSSLLPVEELVDLALRRNPKRAHLLVSRVLAKHVPTEPGIAIAAGLLLGLVVRQELIWDGSSMDAHREELQQVIHEAAIRLHGFLTSPDEPDRIGPDRTRAVDGLCRDLRSYSSIMPEVATIGYAETATGLGQLVAETLGTYYIHSTRHAAFGEGSVRPYGTFEEPHSHAPSHQLLPTRHAAVSQAGTLVLVDDEFSTGVTIVNTIVALHKVARHRHYVVASLVDLRSETDKGRLDALATELGCRISVVALANGAIHLPDDLPSNAASMIAQFPSGENPPLPMGLVSVLDLSDIVPGVRSPRFGVDAGKASELAQCIADEIAAVAPGSGRILVLATEEFMALPLATAHRLQSRLSNADIRYSTSTRSPIAVLDQAGYAIRSSVRFLSHDEAVDGPGPRFAYNFAHPAGRFDEVVIMAEPGTAVEALIGPASISHAIASTGTNVRIVLLRAHHPFPEPQLGPAFGSYSKDEVQWLLKDISFAQLEAPTAEREAAIQSGAAHYAESLPQEYEPPAAYQELFHQALMRSSARVARAVGTVTEKVLALRGGEPVLVSLARAGTPIGVLMKRWAKATLNIDLPHYTLSIVRGVGIDQTALSYLASHHRPEHIIFVDGWTGKGAIARELASAVELFERTDGARFHADLAVLADPGHCVQIFGTREDFLIPSACLNSTVSGLVSRTVFNRELILPNDFHGAKFYDHLADQDVSGRFLDAVTEQFSEVRADALAGWISTGADGRDLPEANWSGWAAVERISQEFGINNTNLVKPGVGETTRVLLRRVPWKILARPDAREDIAHVLLLAELRHVEVVYVPDLPYSCVGLIHPLQVISDSAATAMPAAVGS